MVTIILFLLITFGVWHYHGMVRRVLDYKKDHDLLAAMRPLERLEYMTQRYGKSAPDRLAEHRF